VFGAATGIAPNTAALFVLDRYFMARQFLDAGVRAVAAVSRWTVTG